MRYQDICWAGGLIPCMSFVLILHFKEKRRIVSQYVVVVVVVVGSVHAISLGIELSMKQTVFGPQSVGCLPFDSSTDHAPCASSNLSFVYCFRLTVSVLHKSQNNKI